MVEITNTHLSSTSLMPEQPFDSHHFLYMLQPFGTLYLVTLQTHHHQMHLNTISSIGYYNHTPNHIHKPNHNYVYSLYS